METLEKKIPVHYFNRGTEKNEQERVDDFLNFVDLKKLKKGDVFYECHFKSGKNYELKLKENPIPVNDGVECITETITGDEIRIYVSGNTEYKAFNLFKTPQNLTKIDDNYVYIIS